jgi:hypothetical protein
LFTAWRRVHPVSPAREWRSHVVKASTTCRTGLRCACVWATSNREQISAFNRRFADGEDALLVLRAPLGDITLGEALRFPAFVTAGARNDPSSSA